MGTKIEVNGEKIELSELVQRVGFCKELSEQIAKPANDALREALEAGERVDGRYFEALRYVMAGETVDPAAFLRLLETKKITRAQYLKCVRVSTEEARKLLAADDYGRMTTRHHGTPAVKVTRKKGMTVELATALRGLGMAVGVMAEAA